MDGPDSSYSSLEIHICGKVEREARIDPPIHTEYFLSGGAMILIFIVEIKGQDESEPEVCKAVDKKTCNFKKQVLCCSPPEAGGICPQYECFPKQYKGEKKKKCTTKCPIHCDEDNVRCDGPVDKKVIIY